MPLMFHGPQVTQQQLHDLAIEMQNVVYYFPQSQTEKQRLLISLGSRFLRDKLRCFYTAFEQHIHGQDLE
jgi:hypothetical protein